MEQTAVRDDELDEISRVALAAIHRAGKLLAKRFGDTGALQVETKSPFDYVTDVDRASEDLIVDTIREHFPEHAILAEERSARHLPSGLTWVVDPLDGTTNFIHGFPFIAISVAVMWQRQVLLGWVYDPLRQELFAARRGQGASCNGQPIQVRAAVALSDALLATGFPSRDRQLLEPYLVVLKNVLGTVSGVRRAGAAALDLAYLACARVDGFWEIALQPWDIAAGSLIVQEAGGMVSDFWGQDTFLKNGHIVAGTPITYPFLLDEVERHLAAYLTKA
jgi:myo-inositol-1(or 4)-monophosphatase